jgi:hypothetical protein
MGEVCWLVSGGEWSLEWRPPIHPCTVLPGRTAWRVGERVCAPAFPFGACDGWTPFGMVCCRRPSTSTSRRPEEHGTQLADQAIRGCVATLPLLCDKYAQQQRTAECNNRNIETQEHQIYSTLSDFYIQIRTNSIYTFTKGRSTRYLAMNEYNEQHYTHSWTANYL